MSIITLMCSLLQKVHLVTGIVFHAGFYFLGFEKLAKRKEYKELTDWSKNMVNHLYWSAMPTKNEESQMILEK